MTFEEWQATRERDDDDDGNDYGYDGPVYQYAAGNIMIHPAENGEPEQYEVIILNHIKEIDTDLAKIERVLWDGWAKSEVGNDA